MAMTIRDFEQATGVPRTAIRFYERKGLLRAEEHPSGNGYRLFGEEHVERVRLIRLAQSLGFSLREIAAFLALHDRGAITLATSAGIVAQKRRELAEKRAEIETLDAYLAAVEAWIEAGGTGPKPAMPNTLGGDACAALEASAPRTSAVRRRAPAR